MDVAKQTKLVEKNSVAVDIDEDRSTFSLLGKDERTSGILDTLEQSRRLGLQLGGRVAVFHQVVPSAGHRHLPFSQQSL